jgi:hypothetical protein
MSALWNEVTCHLAKESGDVSPHSKSYTRWDGLLGRDYNFAAPVKTSRSGWGV